MPHLGLIFGSFVNIFHFLPFLRHFLVHLTNSCLALCRLSSLRMEKASSGMIAACDLPFKAVLKGGAKTMAKRRGGLLRPQLRSYERWRAHSRGAAGRANRNILLFLGFTDRNFPDKPTFCCFWPIFCFLGVPVLRNGDSPFQCPVSAHLPRWRVGRVGIRRSTERSKSTFLRVDPLGFIA